MDLAQLVEIEAIKQLKYRYMRCLDQKLWDELAECFAADASAAYGGGRYSYQGRDAILGFLRQSMGADSFHSAHHVHHPEIRLTGATTAHGTWALQDTVIETRWDVIIRGAAFYEDDYVKEGDTWRIRHTGYKRLFEEMLSRKDVPSLKLTASWWSTGGQSELGVG